MPKYLNYLLLLAWCGAMGVPGPAQTMRERLEGLVFEAEDWSTPRTAWVKDQHPPDKWCLWTQEEDVERKRSRGASLQSPRIEADRATPEEGAPPLHTHLTGLPPGMYHVYLNNPNRIIALSFDGQTWAPWSPGRELDLGVYRIEDGTFDLWVDDRYANPTNLGSCYYDYLRFVEFKPPTFSRFATFNLSDGRTQLSWITSEPVRTGTVEFGLGEAFDQTASSEETSLRNHRVTLPPLKVGQTYTARVRVQEGGLGAQAAGQWVTFTSPPFEFTAGKRPTPPQSHPQTIPLTVAEPTDVGRTAWPVTSGVPFARGTLADVGDVSLEGPNGRPVPFAQFQALSHWPDGSVKWLLVSFPASTTGPPAPYRLKVRPPGELLVGSRGEVRRPAPNRNVTPNPSTPAPNPFAIAETADGLVLANGLLQFHVSQTHFALFDRVAVDTNRDGQFGSEEIITDAPMLGNLRIMDEAGQAYGGGPLDVLVVEERGPARAVVRAEGDFVAPNGAKLFRYRVRLTAYAGQPFLRLQFTVGNNRTPPLNPPLTKGGPGEGITEEVVTALSGVGLRVPLRAEGPVEGSLDGENFRPVTGPEDLWLLQDYENHFTLADHGETMDGERAPGLAMVRNRVGQITAVIRDFWQTYPKGLAIKPDGLHLRLLPGLPAEQYTSAEDQRLLDRLFYWCRDGKYLFKRGLEMTSEVWVRLEGGRGTMGNDGELKGTGGKEEVGRGRRGTLGELRGKRGSWRNGKTFAAWVQQPLVAVVPPEVYCGSGAFGRVRPYRPGEFEKYEALVQRCVETILANREAKREYGWMNFGDWHGERTFNWGNSEYDLSWAMALHFARTGRLDYFRLGEQMARHYTTIDTLHYPWAERMAGRVYAHSVGHTGGFFAPDDPRLAAREEWGLWAQSAAGFINGAIDPGGHIYQQGNFLYYLLTGERRFLEVAEEVVGAQAAYLTPAFDFSIERGAGWPLINAVSAYNTTGNPFYRNAAQLYVEKILAKQNPEHGGWDMPQGPPECDERHLGGKSFATGILLCGLAMYEAAAAQEEGWEPSAEAVRQSIVRAADWLVEKAWNAGKQGFRYKTNCPKYADSADQGATCALTVQGLAWAYAWGGDERHRALCLHALSHAVQSKARLGKEATMLIRQSAEALPFLAEWGYNEVPEPGGERRGTKRN